jgi:hypothetical protein
MSAINAADVSCGRTLRTAGASARPAARPAPAPEESPELSS